MENHFGGYHGRLPEGKSRGGDTSAGKDDVIPGVEPETGKLCLQYPFRRRGILLEGNRREDLSWKTGKNEDERDRYRDSQGGAGAGSD